MYAHVEACAEAGLSGAQRRILGNTARDVRHGAGGGGGGVRARAPLHTLACTTAGRGHAALRCWPQHVLYPRPAPPTRASTPEMRRPARPRRAGLRVSSSAACKQAARAPAIWTAGLRLLGAAQTAPDLSRESLRVKAPPRPKQVRHCPMCALRPTGWHMFRRMRRRGGQPAACGPAYPFACSDAQILQCMRNQCICL